MCHSIPRQRYFKLTKLTKTATERSITYNFISDHKVRSLTYLYLELYALQEQGIVSLQDVEQLQQDPDLQILVDLKPELA